MQHVERKYRPCKINEDQDTSVAAVIEEVVTEYENCLVDVEG